MLTYANMNMKKNMTRLWCKIMFKISVDQTKGNEKFYFYLYPSRDLIQIIFHGGCHEC